MVLCLILTSVYWSFCILDQYSSVYHIPLYLKQLRLGRETQIEMRENDRYNENAYTAKFNCVCKFVSCVYALVYACVDVRK